MKGFGMKKDHTDFDRRLNEKFNRALSVLAGLAPPSPPKSKLRQPVMCTPLRPLRPAKLPKSSKFLPGQQSLFA
jgi:hypothetical protein